MFTDPGKNVRAIDLRETDVVADLGAGTGYYALAASALVQRGRVYVVEIQKDFLATVANKARDAHRDNIECLWGDVERIGGTKLGDAVADAAIASNILSQLESKEDFAA